MSRAFPPPSLVPSFSLPSSLLPLSLSSSQNVSNDARSAALFCLSVCLSIYISVSMYRSGLVDSYWLMRSVVMRVHPTFFPGVSEEIWRCADPLTHSRTDDARIRAKDPHP